MYASGGKLRGLNGGLLGTLPAVDAAQPAILGAVAGAVGGFLWPQGRGPMAPVKSAALYAVIGAAIAFTVSVLRHPEPEAT